VPTDDLGTDVELAAVPRRVVSLVPSLTQTIALSAPGVLVGATTWCTEPIDLDVVRVGGTKNPDIAAIRALGPDLVVANEEENRRQDVDDLRSSGIRVWVTDIRSVDGALASIARLLEVLDAPHRGWLDEARHAWVHPPQVHAGARVRAVIPIWRRPWMFLGSGTYAGDVLRRLGVDNVLACARYPAVDLGDLPAHDLAVLPDEPYRFTTDDGPQAFPGIPCALIDGRALTWYGPAMVQAPAQITETIRAAL
jgi:ABC-type Fe3+-hydroxamate transport system substrate-binding protein